MAYFLDPEKAYGAQPVTSGTATVPSSTSYAPAGAPQSEGQQGAESTGGDFISFDRYFNANKQSAQNTANQLASGLEKEGNAAAAGIGKAQSNFLGAANAGTVTYNPNTSIAQSVQPGTTQRTGMMSTTTGQGLQGTPQKASPGTVVSPDTASTRAKQTYTGPKSMAEQPGYDALQKQVGTASDRANATKDTAGLGSLLQDKYAGQTGYMGQAGLPTGSSVLDANLINRAGGSRWQQLRSQYGGLSARLDKANQASADRAAADTAASTAAAGQWQQLADNYAKQQAAGAAQQQSAADAAAQSQKATQDRWIAATKGRPWAGVDTGANGGGPGYFDHKPSWDQWDRMGRGVFSSGMTQWFPDMDQGLYNQLSDEEVLELLEASRQDEGKHAGYEGSARQAALNKIKQQHAKPSGPAWAPWLKRK